MRVTATYAVLLALVALGLVMLGSRAQSRLIDELSTNLHNLARGHLHTLIGSAFVTADNHIYLWLPGLVCLLALGELLWSGKRLVVAFTVGHIGATLIIAAGLAIAILAGWLPTSLTRASDVGISYGAAAVLGALTASLPLGWRFAWVCFWLTNALLVVTGADGFDFSAAGHVVAFTLGVVLSTRFRSPVRWTAPRIALMAGGVVFGYQTLIGFSMAGVPLAGLVAAVVARLAALCVGQSGWRVRPVARLGVGARAPRLGSGCPRRAWPGSNRHGSRRFSG